MTPPPPGRPEPAWPSTNGNGNGREARSAADGWPTFGDANPPQPSDPAPWPNQDGHADGVRLDPSGWPARPNGAGSSSWSADEASGWHADSHGGPSGTGWDSPGGRSERPPDASGWSSADGSSGWPGGGVPAAPPVEQGRPTPRQQVFVPAPEDLDPLPPEAPASWAPPAPGPMRPPGPPSPRPRPAARRGIDRRRLAVVYDIEGPRVRLGVAWFAVALGATLLSAPTTALVYAAAAGLAARQIVRAWGSVSWQADVAAAMGALPVLAALVGVPFALMTAGLVVAVSIGCSLAPDGERLPGSGGRLAAAGILCLSLVPALAGASFVLIRVESVIAATVLLLMVSAYEAGDYIVGSGASNPVEGPLAGITTSTLLALPLALVLVEPFDAAGIGLLAFAAVACPLGQIVASAALPGAAAHAPALRRLDTLLVLAPVWAAAAGVF